MSPSGARSSIAPRHVARLLHVTVRVTRRHRVDPHVVWLDQNTFPLRLHQGLYSYSSTRRDLTDHVSRRRLRDTALQVARVAVTRTSAASRAHSPTNFDTAFWSSILTSSMAVQPVFGLGLDASLPSSISSLSLGGHSSSNMLSSGNTAAGSMSTGYATTPIGRGSMDSNMPSTSSGVPYIPSPRHSISGTPRHSFNHGSSMSAEEGTLRALCELDCGFPLLMDRTKQSMASCRVRRSRIARGGGQKR